MRPLNRNILVKRKEIEQTSELIITSDTMEAPNEGVVVAKAKDCQFQIEIGDTVVFNKWENIPFGNLLIISEECIYGVKDGSENS